jgi:hypothetical protein
MRGYRMRGQEAVKKLSFGRPGGGHQLLGVLGASGITRVVPTFLSPSLNYPTLALLAVCASGRTISSGCNLGKPRSLPWLLSIGLGSGTALGRSAL